MYGPFAARYGENTVRFLLVSALAQLSTGQLMANSQWPMAPAGDLCDLDQVITPVDGIAGLRVP